MHACRITLTALLLSLLPSLAWASRPHGPGAGQLLLRSASAPEGTEAPAVQTDVRLRVAGIIARVEVTQVFANQGTEWAEGIYAFPLPENAAVDHLRLLVGDRVIEGEIREREEAKAQYEAAKAAGSRAALLDQERPNLFTTSVANIAPGDTITVTIEYQQVLRLDAGSVTLRFPMTMTPRFIPGGESESEDDDAGDAARISPPVLAPMRSDKPEGSVTLQADIDAGVPIALVESPSHEIVTDAVDPSHRSVRLAMPAAPVRDFELTWMLEPQDAPRAAVFVEHGDGVDHVLLLVVPPEAPARDGAIAREVVFVIDTSGSMSGASMGQARAALSAAIERLEPGARFNVIRFSDDASALWPAAREAGGASRPEALEFVAGLRADGGTNIAAALDLALDDRDGDGGRGEQDADRVRQVVFITDGAVGNEEALFSLIARSLGDSRLFTIGIGSAPNAWFMTKAAETGRGTYTYIGSPDDVAPKMTALFGKLETAVMTDLVVEWPLGTEGDIEAWPARLPDLYAGEPLVLTAAITKGSSDAKGWVRLSGMRGSENWSEQLDLDSASEGDGIGVLWARAKIGSLMDGLHQGVAPESVRDAVVAVALQHHLVSKYTSLVAVDDDVDRTPARAPGQALLTKRVPLHAPDGWESPEGCLPNCATSWRFDVASGLGLALAGLALAMTMLRRTQAS